MEKLRSVNTKFWIDPYIETIDSKEKLLFLYLLTNPLANILGIYEISLSRISFDTGLTIEMIEKALKGFEKNLKVFYLDGFIILANFQKNQNMNSNMEKGAIELFKKLPNKVKTLVLDKELKGFERLSNGFKDFEKYESESEIEDESESEDNPIFDFKKSFLNLGVQENIINDWLKVRKAKKGVNTETSFIAIKKEIDKSGITANDCIRICAEKNWVGLKSEWLKNIGINPSEITSTEIKLKDFAIPSNDFFGYNNSQLLEFCKQGKYQRL